MIGSKVMDQCTQQTGHVLSHQFNMGLTKVKVV